MGVSFRVAKGVYLHSGRSYPMNRKYTQNEIVHSGEILLTNKRLLLVSPNDSAQINLSSIVNVTPYTDGIMIQKNRGKDVTLGDFDGEELAILLTRLASNDLYAHSGYVDPSLTGKISVDDFAQAMSKDLIIRQDKQQQFLDVVTEGDLSELKDIYIYKYEDYSDTIDNLVSKAYEMYKFIESKTDITGYTIRFYADKEFKQLLFQFKNGQIEYLLFTDPKFIDYLNNN